MQNAPPPDSPATAARAAGIGVVASLVAFALAASLDLGPRVSTDVVFGVLTSLLLAVLVARGTLIGRMGAVASLATLGWVPALFLGVVVRRAPIVDWNYELSDIREWNRGAIGVVGPVLLVPLLIASSMVARWARLPAADRVVRAGAWASLVVVALGASVAALRIARPDADTYVASLPVVQTVATGEFFELTDGTRVTYRSAQTTFGHRGRARVCSLEGVKGASYYAHSCRPLTVRHDATLDLWVLDDGTAPHLAFRGGDKRSRDIWVSDVATVIAPPLGWTVGAMIGLALEAVLIGCALRVGRRRDGSEADAVDARVEGALRADGWVTLPGQPPVHLHGAAGLAPGPVVLRLRARAASSYREAGAAIVESWQPGTLAQAKDGPAARATALYALATASGLLAAAPLLLSGLGRLR